MATNSKKPSVVAVAVVCVMVVLGTAVMLQSQELKLMMPRSLSSASTSIAYQLQHQFAANTTSIGTLPPSFMETISCELPIPSLEGPVHGSASTSTSTPRQANASSTSCALFFPERFFASNGKIFQHQYKVSKMVKTEHPVVHMTLHNKTSSSRFGKDSLSQLPQTLTYLHVRKCGGTTMFRSVSSKNIQLPYTVNKYNRRMISDLGIVQDIHTRQQQRQTSAGNNDDAVVFSFVRDPVIRFLSSVGQIRHMGKGKVNMFSKCQHLMELEEDFTPSEAPNAATIAKSQALVRCMLESIKASESPMSNASNSNEEKEDISQQASVPGYNYIDQHLLPQAYELRARSLEYNISIRLMSMEHIGATLKSLVGGESQNRHSRSSRVADYTHGYYLDASILTEDMIADICRLYAVDVLLLKTTGLAPTLCDEPESST